MKLVVMYPDYKALGIVDFTRRIKEVVPDAIVVPVVNGLSESEFADAERTWWADCVSDDVLVCAREAQGLLSTLQAGYSAIAQTYRDTPIVRLDTAEHPIEEIPRLARAAMDCGGMAIGDLAFDEHTLRKGSVDEFAHRDLFPTLFRETTSGRLAISCAHDFQAFAPGRLAGVFHGASLIRRRVELKKVHPIEWGFDAAMALAAVGLDVPVTVCPVQATTLRDRPRAKIAVQFSRALQMCLAARQIFPNLANEIDPVAH